VLPTCRLAGLSIAFRILLITSYNCGRCDDAVTVGGLTWKCTFTAYSMGTSSAGGDAGRNHEPGYP